MASNGYNSSRQPASATTPNQSVKNHDDTTLTSPLAPTRIVIPTSRDLVKILENNGLLQTNDEITRCENALKVFDRLVQEWIKTVSLKKPIPKATALKARAIILTCGAHFLGVQDKLSEIDVICIVPKHIERNDFFLDFLKSLLQKDEVLNVTRFGEGHYPVLKMTLDDVSFSVGLVQLNLTEMSEDLVAQKNNLHPDSIHAFKSYLVGKTILQYLPNLNAYRMALRAVKWWARINGVYGGQEGYLGGVSWALLVARTCQKYPYANAAYIMYNFFRDFSNWNWPTPVTLATHSVNASINLEASQTENKNMPVLSPVDPYENTASSCSSLCKEIIVEELKRGSSIVNEIMCGKASWDKLFQAHRFRMSYSQYIVIRIVANSAAEVREWSRYIQTRLQLLPLLLKTRFPLLTVMRIWPTFFRPEDPLRDPGKRFWVMGLEADTCGDTLTKDKVTSVVNDFAARICDQIKQRTPMGHGTVVSAHYVENNPPKQMHIPRGLEKANDQKTGFDIQNGRTCMTNDKQIETLTFPPPTNFVAPNRASVSREFSGLQDNNSSGSENVTVENKEKQLTVNGEETDVRFPSVFEDNYSWCTPQDREWIQKYETTGTLPPFKDLKPPNYPTW